MFVLAHLSDPHLGPLPRARIGELASKRLLGYLNWRRSRSAVHRAEVLDAILSDLRTAKPDHIAVTGDLVNIALPAEFERARHWLERLGTPSEVSLVPGNHDAYVSAAALHRDRHWAPYMAGDDGVPAFPYLRRRGPVALVGLSTAVATAPFLATGRLGAAQIERARALLAELGAAQLFRIVMIHHPPRASSRHKRLVDAADLCRAIGTAGAELMIHGHDHVHSRAVIAGPNGTGVPVIGVPSASAAFGGGHHGGGYNLYRVDGAPGAWRCTVVSRGLTARDKVGELARFDLT
jgi:3',5'-cyclic AMP phosphodiesterase CpdA